ncbi:nectin-3 [Myripristis murdjan]|uniref:nectin-3 n=1 Tax=Myripristis murdjan TaxID=586833 RepID=UPI0011763F56|nr:nectin-3-like [Myripristis murdjan]XP_029937005.1 nectin-3-like [Myripristis murdjan]XP_029937006.1 nectin-3-like [Myripristis murdjan]
MTVWLCLLLFLLHSTYVEVAHVIGANRTAIQGQNISLLCRLTDTDEELTQISWQKKTREDPVNHNFYIISPLDGPKYVNGNSDRITFIGSTTENNGSVQLSHVRLLDEGVYTCIFTLFPSGIYKTEIPLTVLVPPVSSLEPEDHLVLGSTEVTFARCVATGAKPPAEVRWDTGSLGESVKAETTSFSHDNITTTTVSSLTGVPSTAVLGHTVRCLVKHLALTKEESLPLTLKVHFPPTTGKISEISKNVFECVSNASPEANFTWTRPNQQWPHSAVKADGRKLHFDNPTADLSGLYLCEASNAYGTTATYLYVSVSSSSCPLAITLCILFFLVAAAAAVVAALYWRRYRNWPWSGDGQPVEQDDTACQEASRERTSNIDL